ncbi:hypothetical protein M8494_16435 [Serratia ureilytica]
MTQTFIPVRRRPGRLHRPFPEAGDLGFNIEEASWLNPVPHVWSVHSSAIAIARCASPTAKRASKSRAGLRAG